MKSKEQWNLGWEWKGPQASLNQKKKKKKKKFSKHTPAYSGSVTEGSES